MKNKGIIALALVLSLIVGTTASFAASWERAPYDENDPVITVTYTPSSSDGYYDMTMNSTDLSEGILDLNDTGYELGKTYAVSSRIDDRNLSVGWFSTGKSLYEARIIGETSPGTVADSSGAVRVWSVTYELVPTNNRPARSDITISRKHTTVKKKITDKVYIRYGKKVSKSRFYSGKPGRTKVKTSKELLKKIRTLKRTRQSFNDAEYIVNPDQTLKVSYNFRTDKYYKVVKEYRKRYRY